MQSQARGRGKELTFTLFIGDKQINELTAEQSNLVAERLSKVMSTYYSAHLDEFKNIKEH